MAADIRYPGYAHLRNGYHRHSEAALRAEVGRVVRCRARIPQAVVPDGHDVPRDDAVSYRVRCSRPPRGEAELREPRRRAPRHAQQDQVLPRDCAPRVLRPRCDVALEHTAAVPERVRVADAARVDGDFLVAVLRVHTEASALPVHVVVDLRRCPRARRRRSRGGDVVRCDCRRCVAVEDCVRDLPYDRCAAHSGVAARYRGFHPPRLGDAPAAARGAEGYVGFHPLHVDRDADCAVHAPEGGQRTPRGHRRHVQDDTELNVHTVLRHILRSFHPPLQRWRYARHQRVLGGAQDDSRGIQDNVHMDRAARDILLH